MAEVAIERDSALRPIYTLVAALTASTLIITLFQRGFPAMSGGSAMSAPVQETLFTFLLFGALLAVALVGLYLDGRPRGLTGPKPLPMAVAGAGIGLLGLGSAAAFAALAGLTHPGAGARGGVVALLAGTIAILFQAGVEEVYFRGWLQPALTRAWGHVAGLLVAAAAFAALHVAGGARSPLTLVNLFLGGILFGLLAIRTRGLAAPIAAHFAWNWAEQILLGLDPNPGIGSFGAIVDLDLVGSSYWGGSDEGLNASLALSFALVALIVPLAAWRTRD